MDEERGKKNSRTGAYLSYIRVALGVSDEVRRQIARCVLRMFALCSFVVLTQKRDIWMHDAKEKPTGVVAYLAYVRILWVASAEVRRQIARF